MFRKLTEAPILMLSAKGETGDKVVGPAERRRRLRRQAVRDGRT
jgi:hypothetical protein